MKTKGNAALKDGQCDEAIDFYKQAIDLEPDNHLLYSNRSAAYAKAGKYTEALQDAEKVIELKPDWGKVSAHQIINMIHTSLGPILALL